MRSSDSVLEAPWGATSQGTHRREIEPRIPAIPKTTRTDVAVANIAAALDAVLIITIPDSRVAALVVADLVTAH